MEEKIKRLRKHLQKIYPLMIGGKVGLWAVGEEEIWKSNPDIPEEGVALFDADNRNGVWLITPYTPSATNEKKNITISLPLDCIKKLVEIIEYDHRSQSGEIEYLIVQRWKDIQPEG